MERLRSFVMKRLTKKSNNEKSKYVYDNYIWLTEPLNSIVGKLGQLEDIEEKLGIELNVLFKALKQQKVWTKYDNEIDVCDYCEYMLLEDFIYFYWDNGKHLAFELKDYGKTWALTKEELE